MSEEDDDDEPPQHMRHEQRKPIYHSVIFGHILTHSITTQATAPDPYDEDSDADLYGDISGSCPMQVEEEEIVQVSSKSYVSRLFRAILMISL